MKKSNPTIKFKNIRSLIIFLICLFCTCSLISCAGKDTTSDTPRKNISNSGIPSQKPDVSQDEEIVQLTRVLDENPEDPTAMYELGMRYLKLEDQESAREYFVRAIELDPTNSAYKISHANTYADQGNVEEAEEIFKAVLSEDSQNADLFVSWGVMYYQLGLAYKDKERMDIAKEKFEKALEIDPKNVKAFFDLGLMYSSIKDYEMAGKYFLDVHLQDPENTAALQHLANISLELNDLDACREYSVKGLALNENAELYYFLGRVAHEKKEFKLAKQMLIKFLEMNYVSQWDADARARLLELDEINTESETAD